MNAPLDAIPSGWVETAPTRDMLGRTVRFFDGPGRCKFGCNGTVDPNGDLLVSLTMSGKTPDPDQLVYVLGLFLPGWGVLSYPTKGNPAFLAAYAVVRKIKT